MIIDTKIVPPAWGPAVPRSTAHRESPIARSQVDNYCMRGKKYVKEMYHCDREGGVYSKQLHE